jgi:phosphoglycerol transferase MdoB-like AlkP superfamily enzyme
VLSGYPSESPISAMADVRRAQGLPYLNKIFKAQGYRTGFTYGGWPNYQNLRAYLFSAGFDSITHANDFVADRRTGKWGVPDEFVFEKFSDEVFHDRQPFFRVMMTQSTRQPYDAPMDKVFKGQDEEAQFMNAVHYTDQWLGSFIDQAKRTLWWQNTLIIITSDQGGTWAAGEESLTAIQSRIPMLWLGGAVTQSGTVIHTQGNQTDICNTLLSQLGQHSNAFMFSRNILSAGDQAARVDYAIVR